MNDYTPFFALDEPPLEPGDTEIDAPVDWPPSLDDLPPAQTCPVCNGNGCEYCGFSGVAWGTD